MVYSFSSALKLLGVFRSGNGDFMEITVEWLIKVGLTSYRRWETGERTIPVNYIVELANYYKVSTDYILGRTDNPEMNTKVTRQVNITNNKKSNTTINM